MNAEIEGTRQVGRPRTRWKNVIQRDQESTGRSMEQPHWGPGTVTVGEISCRPHADTKPREVKSSKSRYNFKQNQRFSSLWHYIYEKFTPQVFQEGIQNKYLQNIASSNKKKQVQQNVLIF